MFSNCDTSNTYICVGVSLSIYQTIYTLIYIYIYTYRERYTHICIYIHIDIYIYNITTYTVIMIL